MTLDGIPPQMIALLPLFEVIAAAIIIRKVTHRIFQLVLLGLVGLVAAVLFVIWFLGVPTL